MNNALLEIDEPKQPEDMTLLLRKKQQDMLKIVEALQGVASSPSWKVLDELVFSKQVERLKKELETESNRDELTASKIYRLQGQLVVAKRYSDFYRLAETYKTELDSLTKKLTTKETNENGDAI